MKTDSELIDDLVARLWPIVHAEGKCECCFHTDEEKIALGEILLKWWDEHDVTNLRDKWCVGETVDLDGRPTVVCGNCGKPYGAHLVTCFECGHSAQGAAPCDHAAAARFEACPREG